MKNSFKQVFVCTSCGATHPKWLGKCPDCGSWNSIQEETISKVQLSHNKSKANVVSLPKVEEKLEKRIFCGVPELDRVLGGGLVVGSLVLLSGDPGIGKSTLLLQALNGLAQRGFKVLYASGEESCTQIKLRAERLGSLNPNILVTNETNIHSILDSTRQIRPNVLVVDSIQTVYNPELPGSPGNVSQIRECTNLIMQLAKSEEISTFVVGHVTKDGSIAGPKVLEHLVDTVMHLEGDTSSGYRILRANKNRFGSTGEIGVFAMQGHGLVDIPNPSSIFLDENKRDCEGAAISVSMEGTRPILIEVQVLVGKTSFASPRRLATGFDTNRFTILLAVLEKRAGLYLSNVDVYANVTGGFKVFEPAIDLATAAAVASSLFGKPLPTKTAFFGEVSLSGEVRMVSHALPRILEAHKLGFEKLYIPLRNYQLEKEHIVKLLEKSEKPFFIIPVESINEIVRFDN
ncbi:DNA repair protein RadA [Fluviispira multicolorata]|uniref:DNA repair protein RadA n=1 Tax=Fluviispira multicolorata TaxID=2654512 RepID=A0A833N5G2_9BACT|nr:DNA repair protein RadA [Fluviispira multicolorata]KAB8033787.1 DNA repair protein RadA [Fluviispira multicolorata]